MALITVDDYSYPQGWSDFKVSEERARWCCSQLEDGHVLLLERIPFDLPEAPPVSSFAATKRFIAPQEHFVPSEPGQITGL